MEGAMQPRPASGGACDREARFAEWFSAQDIDAWHVTAPRSFQKVFTAEEVASVQADP
jgi:hypothetical protein